MSTPTYPNDFAPVLNPQIAKDWNDYEISLEQYKADCEEIKRLAAALASMKNPMFGVQEVMGAVMNMSGDQISSLSSLDNLDTDLRNLLQGAQNGFNGAINDKSDPSNPNEPTSQQTKDGKEILDNIRQLEAFIKWQQSLGGNSAFDSGTLNNMLSAINNIKSVFTGNNSWGVPGAMGWRVNYFASQPNGNYAPELKTIQDGFQTLNQSTSALSTTTNTKLQFTTEQYKQYLGIDQSTIQAYLKLTAAMIQNEKTS